MGPFNMEDFDKMLQEAITEIFSESLGNMNAQILLRYFESRSCPIQDVPQRLAFFSSELRKIFGFGRGMMVGSAVILEKAIAEALCRKIGAKYKDESPFVLYNFVEKLREEYAKEKQDCFI